jgi:hypothetical protein
MLSKTLQVAVLYSDLAVCKVEWSGKETLKRDDVLAIAIVHPKEEARRKRHQAVIEHDFYVLAWTDTECYLGGYDDDYYWFSLTEPWKPYGEGFTHRFPFTLPENSMLFEGVFVDKEVYAQAKLIFGDREGPMF